MKEELLYLIDHNDFTNANLPNVTVSYSFVLNFLINYGLGLVFVLATVFSLLVGLLFRRRFPNRIIVFDVVCLLSILIILGIDMYLGVTLDLKVPYTSAIKYCYQSLPFFSLVVASLASKSILLFRSAKKTAIERYFLFFVGLIGIALLVSPIVANMFTARQLATSSFLIFRVTPDQLVGYSFHVLAAPLNLEDLLLTSQFWGFAVVFSGLFWAGRRWIMLLINSMSCWIKGEYQKSLRRVRLEVALLVFSRP